MASKYNATVYQSVDGMAFGTFLAEVNEQGKMLRSNWVQFTKYDGTDIYDLYIRLRNPQSEFTVVLDGGQGYKNKLLGLDLPPAYTEAASQPAEKYAGLPTVAPRAPSASIGSQGSLNGNRKFSLLK